MENFLESPDDLKLIEKELRDYDDLQELVNIITSIFNKLTNKIDLKLSQQKHPRIQIPQKKSTDYDKLETTIQKHEAEIRDHIRNEQQMKLFVDQLQQQLDDSEQTRKEFVKQTTKMINNFKRENVALLSKLKQVNIDNDLLCKKIHAIGENQKGYDDKLVQIPEMKEQIQSLLQILQRNQKVPPIFVKETLGKHSQHQSFINLGKDPSEVNQSTENPAISQVSTKLGGLTNSGSTPLKFSRKKPGEKARLSSNRALHKEDLTQLQRQRGVSMNIKRDLSINASILIFTRNKSYSLAQSKHNSQENSLNIDHKKHQANTSFTGRVGRRNSTNEQSQRKHKYLREWQENLLKRCQK